MAAPDPPAPGYLRPGEVAALFHVSLRTVDKWTREGRLPCRRTLGGHRRFEAAEIRKLLDEHTQEATTDART